jgi:hypothetical protein
MARASSQPPNDITADRRPHRVIVRCADRGRHFCVAHEYSGERLEGAALELTLAALGASIDRLIETSHSRETGTPRQATPEQEGKSTDAKRKERNRKRRERRKNLRAKILAERKDAENEGTRSKATQSTGTGPESSDTNIASQKKKGAGEHKSKSVPVWQGFSEGRSSETTGDGQARANEPSDKQRRGNDKRKDLREQVLDSHAQRNKKKRSAGASPRTKDTITANDLRRAFDDMAKASRSLEEQTAFIQSLSPNEVDAMFS